MEPQGEDHTDEQRIGPVAWRGALPSVQLSEDQSTSHFVKREEKASIGHQSSTCRDRGDSAHLEQHQSPAESQVGSPTLSTDEWVASVGGSIDTDEPTFDSLPIDDHPSVLDDLLREAAIPSATNDGKKFIPIDSFDRTITRENVRLELEARINFPTPTDVENCLTRVWDRSEYGDHEYTSRKKIFAVLVLLEQPAKIFSFIREGLWDKDLPFLLNEKTREYEYHPSGNEGVIRPVKCLNEWRPHNREEFDLYQWWMLSPIFDMTGEKVRFYPLQSRIVLPFIEVADNEKKDSLANVFGGFGGFSEVRRVEIHPAHFRLPRPKDPNVECRRFFAVKRLLSNTTKEAFDNEVETLKRFSNEDYVHLIKLLLTFKHCDSYHLVFHWADCNLREFWKQHPSPDRSLELARWTAHQCRGIAKGLKMIHNNEFKRQSFDRQDGEPRKGRHGDIKPENILWFKDYLSDTPWAGTLKIADFGLTRWHQPQSLGRKYKRGAMPVDKTYRAPEHDLGEEISQPWDVWTLGCLYLEFLTWYLCGWDAVESQFCQTRIDESRTFIKEDNFFDMVNGGAILKHCVVKWINTLHATEGCTAFISDFLDLISNHLLRIRPCNRYGCDEIVTTINGLYQKCIENPSYCLNSIADNPRKRSTNESDCPVPVNELTIKESDPNHLISDEEQPCAEASCSKEVSGRPAPSHSKETPDLSLKPTHLPSSTGAAPDCLKPPTVSLSFTQSPDRSALPIDDGTVFTTHHIDVRNDSIIGDMSDLPEIVTTDMCDVQEGVRASIDRDASIHSCGGNSQEVVRDQSFGDRDGTSSNLTQVGQRTPPEKTHSGSAAVPNGQNASGVNGVELDVTPQPEPYQENRWRRCWAWLRAKSKFTCFAGAG